MGKRPELQMPAEPEKLATMTPLVLWMQSYVNIDVMLRGTVSVDVHVTMLRYHHTTGQMQSSMK